MFSLHGINFKRTSSNTHTGHTKENRIQEFLRLQKERRDGRKDLYHAKRDGRDGP